MKRRSPFLLAGGTPRDRQAVRDGWGLLPPSVRDLILGAGVKGRCATPGTRLCDLATVDIGEGHGDAWALFVADDRRIYFSAGVTVATVLHELGHAVDFACGEGRLFATVAPAYVRHFASRRHALNAYAAQDEREHFAEAFRMYFNAAYPTGSIVASERTGGRNELRERDPETCAIIDAICDTGTWPPGMLTWPTLTHRLRRE